MTIKQRQYLKMKNSIVELSMEEASYAILPGIPSKYIPDEIWRQDKGNSRA